MSVKDKILRILALALEINPPEIKDIGEKKTAVFVNWFPHTNHIILHIHRGGWKMNSDADEIMETYTASHHISMKDIHKNLDSIIAQLKTIRDEEVKEVV